MSDTQTLTTVSTPNTIVSPAGPAAKPPHAPEQHAPRSRRVRILIVAGGIIAALLIWRFFFAAPALPEGIVALSGRIEGDDSAVAPKTSGKILEITVREGDSVTTGQVIARLDDAQVRAAEEAAKAALVDAQAKMQSANDQISVFEEQLHQNQLQATQSDTDAQGRVLQAQADLTAAEADLASQQAALRLAEFNRDAYTRLAKSGAVSEQQGLQADANAEQQAAAVSAAQRRVEAARGALTTAQANLDNPKIRDAQVASTERQIIQQKAAIAAAKAETSQAQAQLAEAEANRTDLTVVAPFSGTVITRAAEPGEVVQAGTAMITLLDLSKVYLRGFVPEGEIGKVEAANAVYQQSMQQFSQGVIAKVDADRNEVQLLTEQQRLVSLQNDYAKQKINLARMVGLPPNDQYEITDDVPYSPAAPVTLEETLQQAFTQRADLKAAGAQLQAAEHARTAARAERYPSLSVNGDYGGIGVNPGQLQTTFTAIASLKIPIWEGGQAGADVQQADATLTQRRAEYEDLKGQVESEVRSAFLDLQGAASQVEVARKNLDVNREAAELTQQKLQAGVSTTVDYTQAQEAVTNAQFDLINAVFAHNIAKLRLARAIGRAPDALTQFLKVP